LEQAGSNSWHPRICLWALAYSAILPGDFDDVGDQIFLILTASQDLALRPAMLSERRAGTPIGEYTCVGHARYRVAEAGCSLSPAPSAV